MNLNLLIVLFACFVFPARANSQTCEELMKYVKSTGVGTTYTSYTSEAISKVTFYEITEGYQTHYFAVVCFKRGYMGCTEYLYQVGSTTKMSYSMNYINSAGKAFWEFIQPYNKHLACGAKFDNK